MSAWSARRQLTFFFFTLVVILAAAGGLLWRFWPRPTCADGRQNQTETGVDCGGACAAVCPNEARAVKIFWARVLPLVPSVSGLGFGVYDLAVLIENPNPDLALMAAPYNIRLVDQDNIFITRVNGSLALAPLEQRVLFASNIDVGRRVPSRALFDFTGPPIWHRTTVKPELTASAAVFVNEPTPLVRAKVSNNSLAAERAIEVAVVLSDEQHNAFAASVTFLEQLAPGETVEVSFSWPRPFPAGPVFIELYPHVASTARGN